jgi:hypothetical protein
MPHAAASGRLDPSLALLTRLYVRYVRAGSRVQHSIIIRAVYMCAFTSLSPYSKAGWNRISLRTTCYGGTVVSAL